MTLPSRAQMLDRFLAGDASYDGRFVTGVTTTGIYCLPSCPAKKPKPENVRFFGDQQGAQRAGFRACRRCRPDHFYAGRDPQLEALEKLFADVTAQPSDFSDIEALVDASGLKATKLNALVREHYHSTPALLLRRARIAHAAEALLSSEQSIADIGFGAGFESLSTFNENFRRVMAMTPGDYRRLKTGPESFTLTLPEEYRAEDVIRYAARLGDASARTIRRSFKVDGEAVALTLSVSAKRVRATVEHRGPIAPSVLARIHRASLRILGLSSDPEPFESWIARQSRLAPLIDGRRGVRNPSTPTAFEALAWSIIGQQVNVSFATELQSDLVALVGAKSFGSELAYPDADDVARLDYADLTTRRFSRSKAEYLIDTARLVSSGVLPLEALGEGSATRARKSLLALRGIGPWSANYVMMRGFGFEDCAPIGDTGLSSGLQIFFRLKERPNAARTEELMRRFAPYRTFATLHLWLTKHQTKENG